MAKLSITVDVPDFEEIGQEELREAVVNALCEKVLGVYIDDEPVLKEGCRGDDPDHFEPSKKKTEGAFIREMRENAKDQVQQRVKAVVESRTVAVVDEVLAGTFQPITSWGDRVGEPTTLRKMIADYGTGYLTGYVKPDGEPVDRYYSGAKTTRLAWHVRQMTETVFKAELTSMVKTAADDVKKQLAGKVAGEITDTVQRLLGLPTAAK